MIPFRQDSGRPQPMFGGTPRTAPQPPLQITPRSALTPEQIAYAREFTNRPAPTGGPTRTLLPMAPGVTPQPQQGSTAGGPMFGRRQGNAQPTFGSSGGAGWRGQQGWRGSMNQPFMGRPAPYGQENASPVTPQASVASPSQPAPQTAAPPSVAAPPPHDLAPGQQAPADQTSVAPLPVADPLIARLKAGATPGLANGIYAVNPYGPPPRMSAIAAALNGR